MSDKETENEGISNRLNELWDQLNSKARSRVQNQIQQYNESIAKEILNGDLQLSNRNIEVKSIQSKHEIEASVQNEILQRASREKRELQNRLYYLNHSISTLQQSQANSSRYEHPDEPAPASTVDLKERKRLFQKEMEERSRKLEALKKEAERREEQRSEEKSRELDKKHQEEMDRKRQEFAEGIRRIKERMDKREIEVKEGNRKIEELLNSKKAFEKLESSFHNVERSLLEERKRRLSEIRSFYKPLDHEELVNHQQRFLDYQKERQEMRQRERKMASQKNYEVPYESVFYKRVKEKDGQDVLAQEKAKLQKVKQFAQRVKDNFKPDIDPNKKREWEQKSKKQVEQARLKQEKEKQLANKAWKKGLEYLHNLKNLPKLQRSTQLSPPKAMSTPRTQYKNYITHTQKAANPWKRILNSSKDDKALKVYYESMKVQQQLKRKEQMAKLAKSKDNEQIDQAYYDMIKAKLEVLEEK